MEIRMFDVLPVAWTRDIRNFELMHGCLCELTASGFGAVSRLFHACRCGVCQ